MAAVPGFKPVTAPPVTVATKGLPVVHEPPPLVDDKVVVDR